MMKTLVCEKATIVVIAALIGFMLVTVLISPVVYDTDALGDTLFMLGAAWRQYLGMVPALDFDHHYGGFTSWTIAVAFTFFGPSVHAFDQALLLLLVGLGAAAAAAFWRRISVLGAMIAFLMIATLLFTRQPLETGQSVTGLASNHAYLYNRIGLCILVIATLFVSLPSKSGGAEAIGGAAMGALLIALMLTKPSFVVLIPAVLAAIAVQVRWLALVAAVVTSIVVLMIVDPWAGRWLASFRYAQVMFGNRPDGNVASLLRESVQIPLAQPLALALVVATLLALLWAPPRPWRPFISSGLVVGAGFGMASTMGGGSALGQLAVPIFAAAMVAGAEIARRWNLPAAPTIMLGALILAISFSVPHAANLAGTTVEGWR